VGGGQEAAHAAPRRCAPVRIRLGNVSPLLRVALASSFGGFYRRRARDVLTLSKRTSAAVPAGHKPRHSTMRPGNGVAPAPEVGVVDAIIPDCPRKQAHTASLPLSSSRRAIRLRQDAVRSPQLRGCGLWLTLLPARHEQKRRRLPESSLVCSAEASTLYGMIVLPMEHDAGEIIAVAFHVTNKAALWEDGLDPSLRRAISRRTQPFPEPAPRRR
jgi:hypothetical protein